MKEGFYLPDILDYLFFIKLAGNFNILDYT